MLLFKNNYSKIFCTEKVSIKREVGVLFYRSKGVKVVILGLERFVAFTLPTHHCFFFVSSFVVLEIASARAGRGVSPWYPYPFLLRVP